jgi:hypothetical protein
MHGPTMRAPAAQRCLWQQTGNVGETLVSAFWQGTHVHLERCRHTPSCTPLFEERGTTKQL